MDEGVFRRAVADAVIVAPHQPRAHRDRLGDAAGDRGGVDLLDQALRRDVGFDVGRIFDDHMRHGFLRRFAHPLTARAIFNMFLSEPTGRVKATSFRDSSIEARNIHRQRPDQLRRGRGRRRDRSRPALEAREPASTCCARARSARPRRPPSAQPDIALKDVVLLPPLPSPEKILCIGVNYANRNAEYKDGSEQAKYPSMFFRNPGSFAGHDQPLIRPPESTQLDYEGEIALIIGREGRRIAEGARDGSRRRLHAVQRGHDPRLDAPLQVQRHAGQELRRDRAASVRISSPPTRSMPASRCI